MEVSPTERLKKCYIVTFIVRLGAECLLWVACGQRLGFLTLLQHWSGAVVCPARNVHAPGVWNNLARCTYIDWPLRLTFPKPRRLRKLRSPFPSRAATPPSSPLFYVRQKRPALDRSLAIQFFGRASIHLNCCNCGQCRGRLSGISTCETDLTT